MEATHINHAEYQKRMKSRTEAELRFIIKDAREAIEAMPNGHKAGYYADEISYAAMELTKRSKTTIEQLKKEYPEVPAWVTERVREGKMTLAEAKEAMKLRRKAFPETKISI